jgi:O-methyltransferase domain/Dimerisation domain
MSTVVRETKENPSLEPAQQESPNSKPAPLPEAILTQTILGSLNAQAVYVAAKLGIADLLAEGQKGIDELARSVEADTSSLYRVMRALSSFGVFAEESGKVFQLTPMSQFLRSDVEGSLRDIAIFMGEDWHWRVWGQTLYSVKTGKEAWSRVHGASVFPYFSKNPEAARIFDDAMSSFTTLAAKAVTEAYDFSAIKTLVDVAGGHGKLLTGILEATPSLRGILFDLPHVIERAKENHLLEAVTSRCDLVSGDFFESVPQADGYIMKHIIHDWYDEEATKILRNISNDMDPNGRVLLVEMVLGQPNEPDLGKVMDIEMLVSPGGKERTAEEYRELFARAGLRLTRIVPTKSPYSVIEAVKGA